MEEHKRLTMLQVPAYIGTSHVFLILSVLGYTLPMRPKKVETVPQLCLHLHMRWYDATPHPIQVAG